MAASRVLQVATFPTFPTFHPDVIREVATSRLLRSCNNTKSHVQSDNIKGATGL